MTLRERVLRGGTYLVLRQGLGLGIGLGGILLLTRLIGPTNYGLYAGALGLLIFLSSVARLGIDVYLVRREGSEDESVYHQAFSVLLLTGSALCILGLVVSSLVVSWMSDPRFLGPLRALLLILPLTVLSTPAVARLERALDYRKVAGLELGGQLLYYGLAVTLAWRGLGVWAPVAGYLALQAWMVGAGCGLARYRPCLFWSPSLLREMMGYGLGYSASVWVWQLRVLVNPLVVGRYAGPQGVGYVALAIQIAESLSFARAATWRISIAALAKVQGDLTRLRRALEDAIGLQTLVLAPLLAGFALVGPWLLPAFFGDRWLPVLWIYPFVALSCLVNAVFAMHSSVLYVLRRNWSVTAFHLLYIAFFTGAALSLVPRLGIVGYGVAEITAFATYPLLHFYVARLFGFSYSQALPWFLAFVPPLFFPLTDPVSDPWRLVLWLFPLLALLSTTARAQVRGYLSVLVGKKT